MTKMHIFELGLASGGAGVVGLKFLWGGVSAAGSSVWTKLVAKVAADVAAAQADVTKAVTQASQ